MFWIRKDKILVSFVRGLLFYVQNCLFVCLFVFIALSNEPIKHYTIKKKTNGLVGYVNVYSVSFNNKKTRT